jgi:hypothetical protein
MTASITSPPVASPPPDLQPLDKWLKAAGLSSATGWRYRRRGWLETVTIAGRPYITSEAISSFIARAKRGDFEKVNHAEGKQ